MEFDRAVIAGGLISFLVIFEHPVELHQILDLHVGEHLNQLIENTVIFFDSLLDLGLDLIELRLKAVLRTQLRTDLGHLFYPAVDLDRRCLVQSCFGSKVPKQGHFLDLLLFFVGVGARTRTF